MGLATFLRNFCRADKDEATTLKDAIAKFKKAKENLQELQKEMEEQLNKETCLMKDVYQKRIDVLKKINKKLDSIRINPYPKDYAAKVLSEWAKEEDKRWAEIRNGNYLKPDYEAMAEIHDVKQKSLELNREFVDSKTPEELDEIMKPFDYNDIDISYVWNPQIDGTSFEARVFFRKDLRPFCRHRKFEDIDYDSLLVSSEKTLRNGFLLMFVDDNGNTKILKNRYGKRGIIK